MVNTFIEYNKLKYLYKIILINNLSKLAYLKLLLLFKRSH